MTIIRGVKTLPRRVGAPLSERRLGSCRSAMSCLTNSLGAGPTFRHRIGADITCLEFGFWPDIAVNNLVRAAAFLEFADLVRELGANPLEILKQVNIKPQQLQNPDDVVSATAFIGALQIAAERTGHYDFGLRLGQRQDVNMLGPVGMLARQCSTLKDATAVLER